MIRFRQHIENTMLPPRNQAATVLHRPPTVKEGALAFAYAHCIDHAVLRLGCTDTKSGFLDTNTEMCPNRRLQNGGATSFGQNLRSGQSLHVQRFGPKSSKNDENCLNFWRAQSPGFPTQIISV